MRKHDRLPASTSLSAHKHVQRLFEGVPADERESVVSAACKLLPRNAPAHTYNSLISFLTTLSPDQRAHLGACAPNFENAFDLDRGYEIQPFLSLLTLLSSLPLDRQRLLTAACRMVQPRQKAAARPHVWEQIIRAFSGTPSSLVPDLAQQIRRLYAAPSDEHADPKIFFDSLGRHMQMTDRERSDLEAIVQQIQGTGHTSDAYGRFYIARALLGQSPDNRDRVRDFFSPCDRRTFSQFAGSATTYWGR